MNQEDVFLSSKNRDRINNLTRRMVEKIILMSNKSEIEYQNYETILFFLADILKIDALKDLSEECCLVIEKILMEIQKRIYANEYLGLEVCGMITQCGNIAFSLKELNGFLKLNNFYKFFLNRIMKGTTESIPIYYEKPLEPVFYDALYGVSGVLYYSLDNEKDGKGSYVNKMVEYLISLTNYHTYNGERTINFHIVDQSYLNEDQRVPNGYFDFGCAHGMMGVLLALCKAKYKNVICNGLEDAIKTLYIIYQEFTLSGEVLKFPTKISYDEYRSGLLYNYSTNAGWCYGNLGIVRGLMKVAKYLRLQEEYIIFSEELLKIINRPIKEYNLDMPQICHGYSSVLAVQVEAYRETGELMFLNTLNRNIEYVLQVSEEYEKADQTYAKNFSLLEGIGGVILALQNSTQDNLAFSKIMMIDKD